MASRLPHFSPAPYGARGLGLVAPVRVDPSGERGPTPRQVRGSAWRRTGPGLYVPAYVDSGLPQQRVLEAATEISEGHITGWAAFAWAGARWFDGRDGNGNERPVPIVITNHRYRSRPGILLSAERLPLSQWFVLDGVNGTHPLRSAAYEARRAPSLRRAVVALDMALQTDRVSIAELVDHAGTLNGWFGIERLRQAIALADENSWSPMEPEMRLHWQLDLGLPHPMCNHPIFDLAGNHLGTPDLLDVEAGVVGEYDGGLHLAGERRASDIQRESLFRRVGLEYVTMTSADRHDPTQFLRRTKEARERALRLGSDRRWTVDPPAWWTPTVTVEQRRSLTTAERERFLRHRAA